MPQLRQDPLAGYWVAIAGERSRRPVQTGSEGCPFCPGNEHLTPPEVLRYPGDTPGSWRLRAFPNKYPALSADEGGLHEVIVESAEHGSSFAALGEGAAVDLLGAAAERMQAIRKNELITYVQFFKNSGPGAGASQEHPHSQLLAMPFVPPQVEREIVGAAREYAHFGECAFCRMPGDSARSIESGEGVRVFAPPAPRVPFELWIVPAAHAPHFETAGAESIEAAGRALHRAAAAVEAALPRPDYNVALHTAPWKLGSFPGFHWHIEILPRITGIGGFELATGCFMNTVSPEASAVALRKNWPR